MQISSLYSYTLGNKWDCSDGGLDWLAMERDNGSVKRRIVDYQELTCQQQLYRGKPLHTVMNIIRVSRQPVKVGLDVSLLGKGLPFSLPFIRCGHVHPPRQKLSDVVPTSPSRPTWVAARFALQSFGIEKSNKLVHN